MKRAERYQLYEKLYFHELERREKISARLALPFAAILSVVGLLSFMLNSAAQPRSGLWISMFWFMFCASSFALMAGAWFFRKAWFGHEDKLLPVARDIERYRDTLEKTYKNFSDSEDLVEKHFSNFLFNYYQRFSSENAISNDERSYNIYRANVGLTIAVLLALAAAIPFYIGKTPQKEFPHGRSESTAASASAPASAQCQGEHAKTSLTATKGPLVEI